MTNIFWASDSDAASMYITADELRSIADKFDAGQDVMRYDDAHDVMINQRWPFEFIVLDADARREFEKAMP